MTYSNYSKMFVQLEVKPDKLQKYIKHNAPKERNSGRSKYKCTRCGRIRGHISKYNLSVCRQCFREIALQLGFRRNN